MQAVMPGAAGLTPSAGQRGRWRYRQAGLTSAAALLAKGAGLASTLVTIPITAPYLGPERFGLFMTISAIPLLLSFTDFGIGNGLLTELSATHGRQDHERARVLVSSAFYMLAGITVLLTGLLVPLLLLLPWAGILNLHSTQAVAEAMPSLAVFVILTLAGIPLGVPQRVQQAGQRGYITNLWLLAGNLSTLVLLVVFVKLGKGLPWLVGAVAGSNLVASALNWTVEFGGRSRSLGPEWNWFRWLEATRVARAGLMIFSSQVGGALLLTAPILLLGNRYGQDAAGGYAIVQRVLSISIVAVSLLMTPLWPAYGEALARGDREWIHKTYRRSLLVTTVVAGVPLGAAWFFAPRLVALLSSRSIQAGRGMAVTVAILCFAVSMRHTISMMVNGCGYLARTAFGFPLAVLFATGAFLLPPGRVPPAAIPLWVAGAEAIVITVLLSDASRILGRGRRLA